jgi:hypothetical protein
VLGYVAGGKTGLLSHPVAAQCTAPGVELGYHRRPVFRFVLLAVFSTVLLIGVGTFAFDAADGGSFGTRLDGYDMLGGWFLEAIALAALFLLIQGRGGSWWLDGLLTACIAWIFRGPVLVLSVAQHLGDGRDPWWNLTLRWLAIYTLAGLLIALLARRLGVRR